MARYLLFFSFLLMSAVSLTAQSSLSGTVTDGDTGEPILFGDVVLYRNGALVTGGQTDFDGNYIINQIDPGTYDVVFKYVGYADSKVTGVVVNPDKEVTLNAVLSSGVDLETVVVTGYQVPLVEQDNTTQGKALTSKDIANLPSKSINGIVSQVAGVGSADEGDEVSIRGSRSDGTYYYIDGIRVAGNLVPQSEIEQLQVITGGIGAKYGDVTGGVISITTKGPSAKFGGGFDLETSEFLDPYGYNLASVYLNGPLLKNKDKSQTVLGYRISGQYRFLKDDDPPATDIVYINDETRERLEKQPVHSALTADGNLVSVSAGDYISADDVDVLDYQPFEENTRLDLTAKLDARISEAIDMSFTGTYSGEKDYFTPGEGSFSGTNWRLLNAHNNPFTDDERYRGNFRIRHRLGQNSSADGEEADKGGTIRNANYTIQAGYERFTRDLSDPRHKENLFNYGYVGSFQEELVDQEFVEVFQLDENGQPVINPDTGQPIPEAPFWTHTGNIYAQIPGSFVADPNINPVLAAYNTTIGEGENATQVINARNGLTDQILANSHQFSTSIGTVYNLFQKRNEQTLTVQASAGFDLMPGGSESGKHSIEFGFLYEDRIIRRYEMNPRALWLAAEQLANGFDGVDENNVVGVRYIDLDGNESDTPFPGGFEIPVYGNAGGVLGNNDFFDNVRKVTGQGVGEYVNVNGLTPDQLSVGMFAAEEIISDSRLDMNYFGYDYTGAEFNGTFEDFFRLTDEAGNLTRPSAPNRPNYTAAYIQDKFKFRDIIIRAGLRVDRFDANTQVLRDPYAINPILTAGDFDSQFNTTRPNTIGEDFRVYVDGDQNSEEIKAYRDGDNWYFPSGARANSRQEIFGGEIATPKLANPDGAPINDPGFFNRINEVFEDYTPQVNVMPRLAFSFPISDDANFFAHYDILVQRPPSNAFATPVDYLLFESRNINSAFSPKPNSNLKPEKTIDYEVGFQQKLSNSSAIKIAAYYRELRDMIQIRIYENVESIPTYFSYDNLDFGTVKGFSFQYDLRRTGNIQLSASYNLQFADGTGSDANSSRGLGSRGILRVLYPLSFDERHRFTGSVDFRYFSGKKYNGPELFGKQILANAGINLQAIAVSGRPYTANIVPQQLGGQQTRGSINGSRLPWNTTLNLRIDKDFTLRESAEGKNPLIMNVYFRVSNLLDRRNIIDVYPATGSPSEDGYLQTQRGQNQVLNQARPLFNDVLGDRSAGFLQSYQWRLANPNFFSLPRRLYLGVRMDF